MLPAETNAFLVHTLRYEAALIEGLLAKGQEFVLTTRFQSDAIETRYGHYHQMSGGPF